MAGLLAEHPAALDGLAARLGVEGQWASAAAPVEAAAGSEGAAGVVAAAAAVPDSPAARILADYPEALRGLAARIAAE